MNDAMAIAATGMTAQSAQLAMIANNVANMSTPGYKRAALRFADVVSIASASPTASNAASASSAGVRIGDTQRSFAEGDLRKVDDPMAVAIQGEGFVEVQLSDGSPAFARQLRLSVNAEGQLVTSAGNPLRGNVRVPSDIGAIAVAGDGQVHGRDDAGRSVVLGRIDIAVFPNPSGLTPVGDGLWRASVASGDAVSAVAGEGQAGRLMQGYQEASNVKLVDEMVQLMVAQRAYEMSVKVMQAADEVAGMANSLRK